MLRNFLLAVSAAVVLCGVVLEAAGIPAFAVILAGGVVFLGTLFERIYYKRLQSKAPGADWVRTTERFVDPQTGHTVTIYVHPTTGERAYVND